MAGQDKPKYRVVWPVVTVKSMTAEGLRWIDVHAGGFVPADADAVWVERHLEAGGIALVAPPAPKPAPPPAPAPPAEQPKAEAKAPAASEPRRGAAAATK